MGVGIFWIGLNRADLGCWRLTLKTHKSGEIYGFLKSENNRSDNIFRNLNALKIES